MEPKLIDIKARETWRRFVAAYQEMIDATHNFQKEEINRVSLVKDALRQGSHWEKLAAMYIAPHLQKDEIKELFDELLPLVTVGQGSLASVWEAILSLPAEWLVMNIERVAEPILCQGDLEDYACLLALYSRIDPELTLRLAHRAAHHSDYDIREQGNDYLSKIENATKAG